MTTSTNPASTLGQLTRKDYSQNDSLLTVNDGAATLENNKIGKDKNPVDADINSRQSNNLRNTEDDRTKALQ